MESVSLTLAEGHECTVVTETAEDQPPPGCAFTIERVPSRRRRLALVRSCDVVHSNGASLALFAYAKLAGKPFVWTHQGYQLVSIDGLGWAEGEPAPLTPIASLRFHLPRLGIRRGTYEALKLGLRRAVGFAADRNVAITNWVAQRQPLPRQMVIYNPFSLARFKEAASSPLAPRYDFLFVGRLVTEKGVRTLLRALAVLNGMPGRQPASLLIVGDGPHRGPLETEVAALNLGSQVHFAGKKVGQELIDTIPLGKIAVVPSEWEEPMGGVALELMAAGRPIIVSERGGLAECVARGGWTFPNGDHEALAKLMGALLDDLELRQSRAAEARRVVEHFDETGLVGQYLKMYAEITRKAGA